MAGAVEHFDGAVGFVDITWETALSLVGIGFAGGLLSGFLGTGGAFIMTPAMMSLGIPGIMAVAANVTHKFGKAIVGAKKHSEMGNVDKKLGLVMFFALFAGVNTAVTLNKKVLLKSGTAGSDLYISLMFIFILSGVSIFMFRDVIRQRNARKGIKNAALNAKITEKLGKFSLPPFIHFKVAGVRASLWTVLMVGLATGYLAGTIGVGGFIGVPAMIYLLGINIRVAAGTELFLAVFSGLQGAFLYALNGYVDLRIPLILYIGSLVGVTLGALVTRTVKSSQIQMVMISIMAMVVVSRAWTVPVYLAEMGYLQAGAQYLPAFKTASDIFLFGSGAVGCGMILWWMFGAVTGRGRAVTRH
ncbi:MAG: sulfite exporter TauE/SafE family protein [Bacillota bacterium]